MILRLSKDFLKWVVLANFIAWPVAYYLIHAWLTNFAYRIHLGIAPFLLAWIVALFIASSTIMFHTIKAAKTSMTIEAIHLFLKIGISLPNSSEKMNRPSRVPVSRVVRTNALSMTIPKKVP